MEVIKMERIRRTLRWSQWPEIGKTGFFVVLIIVGTLGAFGLFTIGMGTSTPLVVVTSGSMSPTLERGHLLVLQRQAPEDVEVDDIIVFNAIWHTEAPVVHRVIERVYVNGEYQYTTQGDNNPNPDHPWTLYDDIVGVVVFAIPYLGNITLVLQEPGVLPLVIVALIVIIILPEFLPKKESGDNKREDVEIDEGTDVLNT